MKFNPPETAPKDRMILVYTSPNSVSIGIWDPQEKSWSTMRVSLFRNMCVWYTHDFLKQIQGWLPMPEIAETR